MSYAPTKVRYGTSVEPWHTLSTWYHADTPLPLRRDSTRAPVRRSIHWTPLGQSAAGSPSMSRGTIIAAGFIAGAFAMHLMMKRRR